MKKVIKKIILILCLSIFLLITGCSNEGCREFQFHMLDVKQGMSVLMECDGHWILYDGGPKETSSYVVSYLKKQGVEKLDYVIASHYDADHISGLVGVLNVFPCDTVLCPDYETDTMIYQSFETMLQKNGAKVVHPIQGDRFYLDSLELQIVGPFTYSYTEENDRSICIRIVHGKNCFLMCGDAGEQAESDMISLKEPLQSDVYVVNHHGSSYSNTTSFLKCVDPKIALISCATGNSYGHPAKETLERLKKSDCMLYRTDVQNNIVLFSDGKKIWSDKEATECWEPGEELWRNESENCSNDQQTATSLNQVQYVCNTNTKKFHYETCKSIKQMKEKNKKYTTASREELIQQGYQSCGNCHP